MKRTAGVVKSKRPTWQLKILSQAIAVAGAGLQAGAAFAACPGTVTALETTTCTLTTDESVTINAAPAGIVVAGANAINITAAGTKTVTNSGAISGVLYGIAGAAGATGTIVIDNNASGTIEGVNAGLLVNSGSSLTLTNDGAITGSSSDSAAGIFVTGDFNGSITNGGTISGDASGNTSFASAAGIDVSGSFNGSLTNTGTISGTAGGSLTSGSALGIYINGDLAGSITNSSTGTISGTAIVGASGSSFLSESAYAAGVYIDSGITASGSLTNNGTISADAQVASAQGDATATGIYVGFGSTSEAGTSFSLAGSLTNNGTISGTAGGLTSGRALGIYINGDLAGSSTTSGTGTSSGTAIVGASGMTGSLTNDGTISANAIAGFDAFASGVDVDGQMVDASITNSANGEITASASGSSATAYGIAVHSGIDVDSTVTNSGAINVDAVGSNSAGAVGILVGDNDFITNMDGVITNDGQINVNASASFSTASAAGILVEQMSGDVTNNGTITVTATGFDGAEAYAGGIVSFDQVTDGATITNGATGVINVTADASSSSAAVGILVNSLSNASIVNDGTITVTSRAPALGESNSTIGAAGIVVNFMSNASQITNNGTINADTANGPGTGFALFVGGASSEGGVLEVLNNPSAVMNGNVFLQGVSLTNAGFLSIPVVGAGFADVGSFISGDYTQTQTGLLTIGAFSLTEYGHLEVTGTADFTANGRLDVNVLPLDQLSAGGILEDVVQAGTLMTPALDGLLVTDNSAAWDFTAIVDGEAGTIDLEIAGHTVPVLAAQSVQVANVNLDELSSIVMGRMDTRRILVDRASHDQNLWFRPYGTTGSQDEDDSFPGYDIDTYGMVIGYDNNITEDWNAGAAFAYSNANIEADGLFNDEIDTDFYQGAVYGYWQGAAHEYIDLMAIYGTSSNDSTRDLGNGASTDGNYDGWYTRLSSAVGKGFPLSDSVTLIPSASVSYTYVKEDGYNEDGPNGLNVDSNDASSLIFGLDGQIAFSMGEGALLTAHVGAGYDALTDDTSLTSNFVGGTPFTTEGNKPDEWLGRAGVGGEIAAGDRVEMHLNYEYEYRDDFTNNLLAFTLRWKI
jgi:outer membrane autotransporter protein